MKKLMFFVVSAVIAGVGFFSSTGEKLVSKITSNDT